MFHVKTSIQGILLACGFLETLSIMSLGFWESGTQVSMPERYNDRPTKRTGTWKSSWTNFECKTGNVLLVISLWQIGL